jgi:hypothetical protein
MTYSNSRVDHILRLACGAQAMFEFRRGCSSIRVELAAAARQGLQDHVKTPVMNLPGELPISKMSDIFRGPPVVCLNECIRAGTRLASMQVSTFQSVHWFEEAGGAALPE